MTKGEVAGRLRAFDWSQHPLGPMESWPPALRAAVTTCLAARSPMQVWWGASSILFYNDAYIPWLGERHPDALAKRAADVYGSRWTALRAGVQRVYVEADTIEVDGLSLAPLFAGSSVEGIVCTFASDRVGDDLITDVDRALRRPLDLLARHDVTAPYVQQIASALDDLLDITRLGRGRLRLERTPSTILEIVADAVKAAGLGLTVTGRTSGGTVWADRRRLTRALAMLLGRTRPTEITVETAGASVHITLDVKAPMTAGEYAPARRLIELHDGVVHERDGRYVVEIPIAGAQRAAQEARTWRVLVVEDDEDAARMTQMMLEQLGYVVALAHDGAVALEIARVFKPDIALLDIRLPVIDGWEVARRLRERLGELPVVALSGYDGEQDEQRSRDAGFADHFRKPINLEILDRALGGLKERVLD